MTVAVPGADEYGDLYTGLEDVEASDVIIPRMRIVHDEAVFENNLSNEKFETLKVVLLNLVKQRIMWADEVEDGDQPQCKSPDYEHGFPQLRTDIPKDKQFPWDLSNFDPSAPTPIEFGEGVSKSWPKGYSSNGHPALACSSCIFKEWDKNGWKQPPCSEQHTYPLMYLSNEGTPEEEWLPALLTLQKTGIKPSRQYISSFAQTRTPSFTVITELSLTQFKRGTVKYCVPGFRKLGPSDRGEWSEYSERARNIRDFVRQAPRRQDDEDGDTPAVAGNVNTAPEKVIEAEVVTPAEKPKATPAPKAATAPAAPADDDDGLPF